MVTGARGKNTTELALKYPALDHPLFPFLPSSLSNLELESVPLKLKSKACFFYPQICLFPNLLGRWALPLGPWD